MNVNGNVIRTDHVDTMNLTMGGLLKDDFEFRVALRDLILYYDLPIEVAFNWKALYEDLGFLVMLTKWEDGYIHIGKKDGDCLDRVLFGGFCFSMSNSVKDIINGDWRFERDYGLSLESQWQNERFEQWNELDKNVGRHLVDIINAYLK